ncbi:G-box binding factor isoform X1 [Glycine max]|uniref:G-box binding factor isoform X1 n=1 Tax=Glycine max TaxID=3847 RepID=UPI001B354C3A|nr:G-box binding factor isoform X1 [Glycine max]
MGNSEEEKSVKTGSPSSSPATTEQTNQPNIHVYPDWAAMQPMMQPYGPPYAAFYSHGGVYTHPAVAIGPHSHGQGVPSSPAAGTPSSVESPTKFSGNTNQGLVKKLKGFDELAMSIGNCNAESAERGAENRLSQSVDTEGSSDGSDGNTAGANQTKRKRSREGTPITDAEGKTELQNGPASKETASSKKIVSATPASVAGTLVGPVVSSGMATALELRNPSTVHSKANSTSAAQPCAVVRNETWLQNERELKRERRKQSNRESARRSRLRKQAETEELARKVEMLTAENVSLKSEITRLTEGSEQMRMENSALREKLINTQLGPREEITLSSIDSKRAAPVSTENLLSRVNNSGANDRTAENENDICENKPNSGAKLHQLLDTNPRANAVAAG